MRLMNLDISAAPNLASLEFRKDGGASEGLEEEMTSWNKCGAIIGGGGGWAPGKPPSRNTGGKEVNEDEEGKEEAGGVIAPRPTACLCCVVGGSGELESRDGNGGGEADGEEEDLSLLSTSLFAHFSLELSPPPKLGLKILSIKKLVSLC